MARLHLAGSRHRARADRGSTAVELVLVTPALMFAIFVLVQAALYQHARQVALAGAQQGARLARSMPAGPAQDEQIRTATLTYLRQLGGDVLRSPDVHVTRTTAPDDTAGVDVTARAVSIVPGLPLTVRAHSAGPTETFRRP